MCADKLRKTFPLNITFSDGEQPSSAKLNAITTQSRNGSDVIESAIGDIWNDGGDPVLSEYPLQLTTLARMIGNAETLSPTLYALKETFIYDDFVGDKHPGLSEVNLQFTPVSITGAAGQLLLPNQKTSADQVTDLGDWYVDDNGKLFFLGTLQSGDILAYEVDPSTWSADTASLPNVIPDSRQAQFTGCRISTSGGNFYIHLPPRMPLTLSGFEQPDRYPPTIDTDFVGNRGSTVGSNYRIFQVYTGTSTLAVEDSHYRYRLPKPILEEWSNINDGDPLPQGMLLLWNKLTNTIVYDAVFRKQTTVNGDWVFQIESVSANTEIEATASNDTGTEAASNYNTDWVVLVSGNSLADNINSIRKIAMSSGSDNTGTFGGIIDHSKLGNQNPLVADSGFSFGPSFWTNDTHVSLLSRAPNAATDRDLNKNAMLGDFILGSSTPSAGNYLNTSADSRKIYFGTTSSSNIYGNSSRDIIIMPTRNLGIGTDNPELNATVEINDGASAALYIHSTGLSRDSLIKIGSGESGDSSAYIDLVGDDEIRDFSARLIRKDDGANADTNLEHRGTGSLNLFNHEAGDIAFYTSSSRKMTIKSGGGVGIGTGSPGETLEIKSDAPTFALNDPDGDTAYLRFAASSGSNYIQSGLVKSSDSAADLYFGSIFNTTTWMTLKSNGKVGIGTDDPEAKFHVEGSGFDGGAGLFESSDNANNVTIQGVNGAGINDSAYLKLTHGLGPNDTSFIGLTGTNAGGNPGAIRFYTGGSEKVRFDTNGRVGIGAPSPQALLHLQSDDNPRIRLNESATTTSFLSIYNGAIGQSVIEHVAASGSSYLDFYPRAEDHTSSAIFRVFRGTETTGIRAVIFCLGDASDTEDAKIGIANQNTYFNLSGGNFGIGTSSPGYNLDINGSGNQKIGIRSSSGGTSAIELGNGSTADKECFIDFTSVASESDYNSRIIRDSGANGNTEFIHKGTGDFNFVAANAADIVFKMASTEIITCRSSSVTISEPLYVQSNVNNVVATFINTGNFNGAYGIRIQAGAGTANSSTSWIHFYSGDSTPISEIKYTSSSPFAQFASISDERLKKNIEPTKVKGLQIINDIELKSFDWIDSELPSQEISYIAQQVETVYPPMVSTNADTGIKNVGDSVLIPVLVKAIQELTEKVEQQQEQINLLLNKE